MRPTPRVVHLCQNNKLGFFITTKQNSAKISQIEKNPFVAVSVYPGQGYESAVAHCTAQISSEQRLLDLAWSDDLKQAGYSGKTDPQLRVIQFTLHSVTFGDKTYAGIPIDKALYERLTSGDVPGLASGPFQTKEVNELLKDLYKTKTNAHLATMNGVGPEERILETFYKDGVGLYQITSLGSQKVRQIHANANVSILLENKGKMEQVVVDAVGRVCTNLDIKKQVWHEGLKDWFDDSPEMKDMVVLIYQPRKVVIHSVTAPTRILQCDILKYDRDLLVAKTIQAAKLPYHVTTVDQDGVLRTRLMTTLKFHQTLGFSFITLGTSRKVGHLEKNCTAVITTFKNDTADAYTMEAEVVPQQGLQFLIPTWYEEFKSFGYKGADDQKRFLLQVNPKFAMVGNVKGRY
ncbi:MAG: hypothetical protein EZS28_018241 [Streblomastix strix]|uniref:General stress protein FMN-binding split barrel domain-containing protein n=1 Tax=Streblomastix strix TaxID=222440 RepID=A0A5J4VV21_9EUKA|nr:MAG: hypothetical protein EZS28_018241 [Streblomastix strix]